MERAVGGAVMVGVARARVAEVEVVREEREVLEAERAVVAVAVAMAAPGQIGWCGPSSQHLLCEAYRGLRHPRG